MTDRPDLAALRVWVQVGGVGLSVPEADGLTTAAELLAESPSSVAAIHEGDCSITRPLMGGTCSCEPFLVGVPPHDREDARHAR